MPRAGDPPGVCPHCTSGVAFFEAPLMQEFKPGDTINNRYKVLRKLGAGAMGSVYLCEDGAEKNIKVALKVLISENLDDQDVWAKGEYEALTRLRHPNLARVYNFGRIGDTRDYFIVSEFIKGIDLFTATEYLNYEETMDIVVQICRALEYIHSQGYVHFDIKPDNILVTRHKTVGIKEGSKVQYEDQDFKSSRSLYAKPKVKLIDFGLAEKITGSFSFAIKGTLNYLAPEILNGSTPDKRADLYSLGVTIYQVFNRDLPFYQEMGGFGAQRTGKRSELFEFNMKKHPPYLQELIMKLLEEDPNDRFQSAKEVIQFINRHSGLSYEIETEETRASYFRAPRLVARSKEMSVLKKHYELTFFPHRVAGQGGEAASAAQLIIVNGEMGAGKSRLLEEFQHFLKLNDRDVFAGNCYEGHQKAYQPIIEILRQLTFAFGPESDLFARYRETILKLLPELRSRRERGDEPAPAAKRRDKHHFIEQISQLLIDAARRSPFVLLVNNLHWVDDASADFFEKFFERLAELKAGGEHVKILAIVSQRAEEQTSERIKRLLDGLRERGFALEIQVRRLKQSQLREFLQSLLGLTDIPDEFVERLGEQTGGNPLFVIETLKALEDEGILKHEAEGWTLKTSRYTRVSIPQSMEDLLLKRIERLEPLKREVLGVMAVLDKPVNAKLLQKFERFASSPILVTLRDLEAAGLVQKFFENGKLHFQIEQPKVREIIYADLSDEARRKYHGEVGRTLEEVYGAREEEILEELAYHYQRSDRTDKAIALAQRAGERLRAIYANERAYEYFAYVLEEVADDPNQYQLACDIREKLADVCVAMGRYEEAEENYRTLLEEENRSLLPPERVTRIFLQRGKVFEIQGDFDSALKCYKDARNYLSSFPDKRYKLERAHVFNSIGWVYVCMGKFEKAMTISLEALRVIGDLPAEAERAAIYSTIGSANYYKGNVREAVEYHRKSLEIRENLENMVEVAIGLNDLGGAYLAGADYLEALEQLRRALEICNETGDPYGKALTYHNLARLHFSARDLDTADRHLEESIRVAKAYNLRSLNLRNYAVRGALCRERGDYSKAEANFFRVLTAFSKQGNRAGLCRVLLQLAEVHRLQGNLEEARNMVAEARKYAEDLGLDLLRARCLLEEARLVRCEGVGEGAGAVALLEDALRLATKSDNPEFPGEVAYELAEALVSAGEVREAKTHYREAESRYRSVLETLPEEFKSCYSTWIDERFSGWKRAQALAEEEGEEDVPESFPEPEAAPQGGEVPIPEVSESEAARVEVVEPEEEARSPADLSSEALRRVNELMLALPRATSQSAFLGELLVHVNELAAAEAGFILSLSGRNLRIVAARGRGGETIGEPQKLLDLRAVEKALRDGAPVFSNGGGGSSKERASAVLPFLEPGGRKGALYLVDPKLRHVDPAGRDLVFQPFLNFLPLCYHHFRAQAAARP